MKKTLDQMFRVVKLPSPLVEAMRRQRDATGTTNVVFVAETVTQNLPKIIDQLRVIGLVGQKGARQTVRLPFSTEAGTLDSLRAASTETGLSAIQLLTLCVIAATSNAPVPKSKRFRAKQSAKPRGRGQRREGNKS
ncbi:MAG: hypothetical protein FJ297_05080 [Planctomycetes bacterium]|nr:hypothetical protein [Planctomycetota bacterium]